MNQRFRTVERVACELSPHAKPVVCPAACHHLGVPSDGLGLSSLEGLNKGQKLCADFKLVCRFVSDHEPRHRVLDTKNRDNPLRAIRSVHRRACDGEKRNNHDYRRFRSRRSGFEWNPECDRHGHFVARPCRRRADRRNSLKPYKASPHWRLPPFRRNGEPACGLRAHL
jgi:hypothetical protein